MDIGAWLQGLGLGQYEATFRDTEIDAEVLLDLTDSDLSQLGVPLGHRKRLLKAITGLATAQSTAKPTSPALSSPDVAERRQLTVMFCDLVGSTAISTRLDPEDMREVIRAYQDARSGAVTRYDGFVAKFMGDGVLAYFGFPRAHEDDAERATRAGLAIAAAVAKLEARAREPLKARIGIATGIVVVGELVGFGSAQEQAVIGETPNLAARLQALAEPGSVVIAEATRKLLGGAFQLQALGPQTFKGFDAPVPAWAVVRETEHISRFDSSQSEGLTPFVGREQEVALLLERWRDAAAGEGQVVLLSGEAGIGKSRILAALHERIGDERHIALRYQCSPHHINDAFYPIVRHIWRAASFASGEPAAARLDKLEAMIARSRLDSKKIAPLLASLLSVPTEGRFPALEIAPAEQKERTIAALIDLFVGLTKGAPALALLEDAHWIDPTSLEMFGRLVERLQGLRALLVVTHRPEFAAPWAGRAHVTALSLNRFGRRQAVTMIERVTGGKGLPLEVVEQIVTKTDGVPLFVEELTKTVLESGLLREESGCYVLAAALTPLAIPSTLQDSLMARLDRLAPVKEIAQIGAAIGREFSYLLLEAVTSIKGPPLQNALGQLMAAELIYARGAPPEASYTFKHALVQDTAYASMLRSRRQRIHADIARALEEQFADQIEAAPAILAHHYEGAGLTEPAVRCWQAAADVALSRSALTETIGYADRGLALIPKLTENRDRHFLELALQLPRLNGLFALKGWAVPETLEAVNATNRLIDAGVGTSPQLFSTLHGLWLPVYIGARFQSALALAQRIIEAAERQDDPLYKLVGFNCLGLTQTLCGQIRNARRSLQTGEQFRDPLRPKTTGALFGGDPDLSNLIYQTYVLGLLGQFDRRERLAEQLQIEMRGYAHPWTTALWWGFAVLTAFVEFGFGDFEAYERHADEFVSYCQEHNLGGMALSAIINRAQARMLRNPSEQNIDASRTALDARSGAGLVLGHSFFCRVHAQGLLAAGRVSEAESALKEGFSFAEPNGEDIYLADLHRVEGLIALAQLPPDRTRADACFSKAVEIARDQGALLAELRAATDLARLWRDTGSPNDPRALLEPILAAIEGGERSSYVREARALLAEFA